MTSAPRYGIRIKRSAEKELDALPASLFERISKSILKLESNPRSWGSKKLRGVNEYRIRVGSYRILYTLDDSRKIVEIMAVGHRRDVYQK